MENTYYIIYVKMANHPPANPSSKRNFSTKTVFHPAFRKYLNTSVSVS